MVDALAARFGGTAYAVIQLARRLASDPRCASLIIATRKGSIIDRGLIGHPSVHLVRLRSEGRAELAQRVAWEALALPRLLVEKGADAVLTFSGMLPRDPRVPVLSYLANPVPFERRNSAGSAVRRHWIARTSRFARATYVPSHHLASLVGGLPRVHIAPLGVDHELFRPASAPGSDLICVSDFYRHKRHDLLLMAYQALPPPRPTLRLFGNPDVDPAWFSQISAQAAELPGVVVAGRVSLDTLVTAYREARAFVLPSEHESFSMPLAEALASGVPAVATDRPSLRETGGGGTLFVGRDDPESWAETIGLLITDDNVHGALREAGLRESARFSWEALATRLLDDVAASR